MAHLLLPFRRELLNEDFEFKTLDERYIDSTMSMFTKAFCDSEPMTKYVNMSYKSFRVFAEQTVVKAAKDGLSAIALNNERVIACDLIEDIANPLVLNMDQLDLKFIPIFTLLEQLTANFFKGKEFAPNHLAHLFITAVDQKYRGLGLSRQINFHGMMIAQRRKFDFMISELTNYLNEKGTMKYLLFDKLLVGSAVYQDFILDGQKPFAHLTGGADAFIWQLNPGVKLTFKENGTLKKSKPL